MGLPNWSHTGLNLTSSLRLDLVMIRLVMFDYLTGQNMTNPAVRLSQVRSGQVGLPNCSYTGLNLTNPPWLDLVRIGQVTSDYLTGQNMTCPLRSI